MMMFADNAFSNLVVVFLQNLSAPRRRGRPKQIWVSEVYRMAVEIAEGFDMLGDLLRDAAKWRSKVRAFCFLPSGQ